MSKKRKTPGNKLLSKHDRVFHHFLSDKETAESLFREYLPERITKHIDFSSLEITKDTFVDKRLARHFSDILYKVRIEGMTAFIYLLIEHKSKFDKFTGFQLLRYIVKIWELFLKQNKEAEKLPPVIPIVLYHGKEKWDIKTQFISLVEAPADLKPYIPDFKYNLQDISHMSRKMIKGSLILRSLILSLKYVKSPEIVRQVWEICRLLSKMQDRGKAIEFLETLAAYLLSSTRHLKEKDMIEAYTENFKEDGGDFMQTVADGWLKEGRKEGEKKGKLEMAKKMKAKGMDTDTIAEISGLPVEEIEKLTTEKEKVEKKTH